MPNVTISVTEELKAEMDKLHEVSWSEICRKAISRYIAQRNNPMPRIELELRNSTITHYSFQTGYPTLSLDLKIHNRMDSEITVDRILADARFVKDSNYLAIGNAHDLRKKNIQPNSSGPATIHLRLPEEKIRELKDEFKSTFDCRVFCYVFVEGFKNEYNGEIKTSIPIDQWNDIVNIVMKKAQKTSQAKAR